MLLEELRRDLNKLANPEKAKLLSGFFKTGKGEYGYGDLFLGVTVPESRKIAIKYKDIPLKEVEELLKSEIHEERLISLLLLVHNYQIGDEGKKEEIFNFYLRNTKKINNWDLVDLSSHKIIGKHLLNRDRKILYKLAKSSNLWEKRIAVISTFAFIQHSQFQDSLKIAGILLEDKEDLIQKAVGWMLREIGKKDFGKEEEFLRKHYKQMGRTMLRYAIERFPEGKRKAYLNGKIK